MTHTGLVVIVATGVSLLGTQAVAQHRHASHFVPHGRRWGASDFTILQLGEAERMFATIEPWHGNKLAVYRMEDGAWARHVIDETLTLGHTVHGADLDGHGCQALVAADRGDNRSVYLYSAVDSEGLTWEKEDLDDSLQPSWCTTADLTSDAQRDIVCIGRAEGGMLRWYENIGSRA